ncbi:MAG: hypothetical protein AAB676_05655 [Verrucomicrobiota bacterium]
MKNIPSDLTPLRRSFIQYLALHRKAERTIHANACLPIDKSVSSTSWPGSVTKIQTN